MNREDVPDYILRPMKERDLEETYHLIDKEGWNLTLDKFLHLFSSCPNAFYVAVTSLEDVVGTISFFPTFDNEYVLGNIVIKRSHRHRGMGNRLVEAMMLQRPGCVVSCTAVPGADQFYLNVGFHLTEPQQGHNIFHLKVNRAEIDQKFQTNGSNIKINRLDKKDLSALVEYDRQAKGYMSEAYITMMMDCFNTYIGVDEDGGIVGYAAGFVKRGEIVLDGLCADSDTIAFNLFRKVLDEFPDRKKVKLQVPSSRLFLSQMGDIRSSYKYNRYSIGQPTISPLIKVYNVSDCDYSY
ncbi:hypothetical protein Btru_034583 [Bulinus truncatus]|nr:hypothetical protein Btru_034583 [Bulinus truncatus]